MRLTATSSLRARTTTIFAAMAVVGLGVAGCGVGFGETETKTVTSTVTVPSDAFKAATFSGMTEQGLPISFTATKGAVLDLTFGWRAPCADGQVRSNSIALGGTSIHNGTFSFGGVLETGGVAQVEGQLEGDRASGTFSRSRGTAFGIDCKVADVAWQARAG